MNLDKRLLRQARAARVDLALTVGLGLLTGVLLVGQARVLSQVVSQVFLARDSLADVRWLLFAFLLLSLARAALAWGSEVTAGRVAGQVKSDLRERLSSHLLALGPAYAHGERSGELVNTVVQGVEALDAYFSQYLPQLALAILVPLAMLAFVFPLDFVSGLVLLLTAPLVPLFMILIGNLADALTRRQWTSLSHMSAHFLDVLQGLTTLKLLGRSRDQIQVIAQVSDRFRQTTLGVLRVAFLSALVMEWVTALSTAVVAVEIGLRLLYGRLSFEQAFFVLVLAPEFYLPLRLLGTRFHAGMAGVTAARRIFDVLGTLTPGPSPFQGEGLGVRVGHICLDDVHYAYDGGQRPALNGLSFQVAPGQKVALVGPSGAGKSTVAHLLLRFIEPDRGTVTVEGVSLRDLPAPAWRAQVAWVPQIPYLFHATVAENIRLARPAASHDEVIRAAQQARAHDFIQTLPLGYDTLIGERGSRLSGGQAQRIALARAFLKDAPLLILDEATSNLDPEHEMLLQEAIDHLTQGRTVLIIAHRLNTVRRADRILVMAGGRVVEAGDHATLLQQDGLYRRLVTAYGALPGYDMPFDSTAKTGFFPLPNEGIGFSPLPRGELEGGPAWRLLQLATPLMGWIALSVLLGFATVGSGIGLMTAAALIIARAALHPSIADLQVAIVGVRFFGIARGVFRYLERYVSHYVTFRLLARLRVWFYQALEPLAPARLIHYKSGDLLSRIVADIETLEHFYVRVIAPPVVALLVGLLMWFLMGSYNLWLAVTLLAFFIVAGLGVPLLTQGLSRGPGQRMVTVRSELNVALVDGVQGVADLVAFGQEERHQERVATLSRELVALQGHMAWVGGLHGSLTGLLMNLAVLAVLAVAIPLVNGARLDGVYLALLVLAVMSSFEAVSPLPLAFQYLENCLQAGRRLFEIVDARPAVYDPPPESIQHLRNVILSDRRERRISLLKGKLPLQNEIPRRSAPQNDETLSSLPPPIPVDYGLLVDGVSFRYQPGEPLALDRVSFALPQGGRLAIVGPSGAGKSTLVNLLLRFWEYEEGSIWLGGHELRRYRQEDLRRMLGVVSQHLHLFNATIRDNLLLARPDAAEADMVRAAQQAQLHDFVQALPHGYDTWIGEQGLRLSGGERRRLAIARALLKDAPLLILDEATADLDPLTERALLQAIHKLLEGRTTLIVTHRLVGLEAADEILVLQAGRVVERGRHAKLLQMAGLYRHMWELQRRLS